MSIATIVKAIRIPKPEGLDAPETTLYHRDLIKRKPFLHKIYCDWYRNMAATLESLPAGDLLEIGSGGGFMAEFIPGLVTSDVLPLSTCQYCCPSHILPFPDDSLSAIFMVDVLHHIPNVREFFAEANRVLKPGGQIIMSEPANTPFSRFIYKNFHHEPFDTQQDDWHFYSSGALSGANGALPWIVFDRDLAEFEARYPELELYSLHLHTPFRYLISGGLSYNIPLPGWTHALIKWVELLLEPFFSQIAMFQTIQVRKKGSFTRRNPLEKKQIPQQYGTFRTLAHIYYYAAQNMLDYARAQHIVFRPILYLAALPAYLSLKFTGIFFHAFIFVDYFGRYLAKLRNNLVVKMNHWTTEAEQSSKHLRRNPLKVAACMPFATITAAIPIVGNGTFAHTASVIEDLSKSTLAQLRQIVRSIYAISYRTIRKPETSPADKKSAYIHLAIFTILGGMIAILSIFDLISDLINNIKTIALQYLNTRSFGIRRNFWGFLLNPLWLLILSPILIAVLLSPYFQLF